MIKLAIKTLSIHNKFYLFVFVQLILTFAICICCVSVITSQLKEYLSFYDYFNKDGWLVQGVSFLENADDINTEILYGSDLEKCLKEAEVLTYYNFQTPYLLDGTEFKTKSLVYDDEIIENYLPELSSGRYLTAEDNDTEIIEAVIGPNTKGLKVGDIIETVSFDTKTPLIEIEIVGKLDSSTKVFDFNLVGNKVSFQNLFTKVSNQDPFEPYLIMLRTDLDRSIQKNTGTPTASGIRGFLIIAFHNDITEEEIKYNQRYLDENSITVIQQSLDIFRDNSVQYIIAQLMRFLPFFVCAFIYTIISLVCVSVLVLKIQIRNYSIYYMLGFPWKKCIGIQLWSMGIVMFSSFFITIVGIWFLKTSNNLDSTLIELGKWQFLSCLLIIAISLGVSAITQYFTTTNTSPQKIYINSK